VRRIRLQILRNRRAFKRHKLQNKKLTDGHRFEDETEVIIFNHYSFCELVKHIMIKYGKLSIQAAESKLERSFLIEVPTSKNVVELIGHDLPFHWAMLTAFGDMYWLKGIPSDFIDFKEEYLKWQQKTRIAHNLKSPFEYFNL